MNDSFGRFESILKDRPKSNSQKHRAVLENQANGLSAAVCIGFHLGRFSRSDRYAIRHSLKNPFFGVSCHKKWIYLNSKTQWVLIDREQTRQDRFERKVMLRI